MKCPDCGGAPTQAGRHLIPRFDWEGDFTNGHLCENECHERDMTLLEEALVDSAVRIVMSAENGDYNTSALEQNVTPLMLAAAAIVEMCRQAFMGERVQGDES